jgi:hypothetical protein
VNVMDMNLRVGIEKPILWNQPTQPSLPLLYWAESVRLLRPLKLRRCPNSDPAPSDGQPRRPPPSAGAWRPPCFLPPSSRVALLLRRRARDVLPIFLCRRARDVLPVFLCRSCCPPLPPTSASGRAVSSPTGVFCPPPTTTSPTSLCRRTDRSGPGSSSTTSSQGAMQHSSSILSSARALTGNGWTA